MLSETKIKKGFRKLLAIACVAVFVCAPWMKTVQAQEAGVVAALLQEDRALERYVDTTAGLTVEQAVQRALEHNGELLAARKEVDAARALVRQATLRANPQVGAGGSKQLNGSDNSLMVEGVLPLELGGRRAARVLVAERELEMREQMLADRERMLAAEVRLKFGEALAEILKLGFNDDQLNTSRRGYRLVVARVEEGSAAPLEKNITLVEVNRLLSMREAAEGRALVALLELRNIVGMTPEEPLRVRGDFIELIGSLLPVGEATEQALRERPDLKAARAAETLAEAQIGQARAAGRPDASLRAGYQRMKSGFMVNGIDERGQLAPVEMTSHAVTFGVMIDLPVRNKNQGMIEAAVAQADAARQRREFLELTIRREVAAGYARYERSARAMEIFRVGVRGQADANLEVIRKTYELGSKSLLDYIAEQRRYYEVEAEFVDAVLNTYQARVEINRASASPELLKK
jgi:cobalt-zinc-cadmium efflux system outer membrane protein